jgi:Fe2+ transport system protein FeoA
MKSLQVLIYVAMLMFASACALAANGGREAGNGGDICEDRFETVRDDIASWISQGGGEGLTLPVGVSLDQYNESMLMEIKDAKISCTTEILRVDGAEKTCENHFDSKKVPKIVCNMARFMATPEADQYVLVHHEYAGLAGLEVNRGPASQYQISNQISEYLVDEVEKKLAVKRNTRLSYRLADFNLTPGKAITVAAESEGAATLTLESNGTLVVTKNNVAVWSSGSVGYDCKRGSCSAEGTRDGNFIIVSAGETIWATGTYGSGEPVLIFQNSPPYLTIQEANGHVLWQSAPQLGLMGGGR